jgi:hypothetical protein
MVASIDIQNVQQIRTVSSSSAFIQSRKEELSVRAVIEGRRDVVELSDEVFQTIIAGIQDLNQADLKLAGQRLQAARSLLETTEILLGEAGSEDQRDAVAANVRDIAESLSAVSAQIQQIFGRAGVDVTSAEVSIEIELSLEQTRIIVAQLGQGAAETLSTSDSLGPAQLLSAGAQFEDILASFRNTLQDFQAALRDILTQFTEEELQPEVPVDLLNRFLSSVQEVS